MDSAQMKCQNNLMSELNEVPIIGRQCGKSALVIRQVLTECVEAKKERVWQKAHPNEKLNGRVIILLDRNVKHIVANNLEAITRAELVMLNHIHGISRIPGVTKMMLALVRLKAARRKAVKGTPLEEEDKKEAQEKYQQSEKGRTAQNKSSRTYWAKHSADPEWRAEYNRKQRERRHREK